MFPLVTISKKRVYSLLIILFFQSLHLRLRLEPTKYSLCIYAGDSLMLTCAVTLNPNVDNNEESFVEWY